MGAGDARFLGLDQPLVPVRALVAPRIKFKPEQDPVPLERVVRQLFARGARGIVELGGVAGSGKTTALAHLAATLAVEMEIRPGIDAFELPTRGLIFRTQSASSCVQVLGILNLARWSEDDLIEYCLAKHPTTIRSILARVKASPGVKELMGAPVVWSAVLDELAADEALPDVLAALQHHLAKLLPDPERLQLTGAVCVAKLGGREPTAKMRAECATLAGETRQLLEHRIVQVQLAAQMMLQQIAKGEAEHCLRYVLPRDLIGTIAGPLASNPPAIEVLEKVFQNHSRDMQSSAASLLHAARTGWKPEGRRPVTLRRAVLTGAKWPGVRLWRADLYGADLRGADLTGADLISANCEEAILFRSSLRGAQLEQTQFIQTMLLYADLTDASAAQAAFRKALLSHAKLDGAFLEAAVFDSANLRGTSFTGARLKKADLRGARLFETNFSGADLSEAILIHTKLDECCLLGARFDHARLNQAELTGVDLTGASFVGASLTGADLTASIAPAVQFNDADLTSTGLAEVDWPGADLRGANFTHASFHLGSTRCGLVGSPIASEGTRTGFYTDEFDEVTIRPPEEIRKANLCGADLRGAKVTETDWYLVDLRGARYTVDQAQYFAKCKAILRSPV